MDERMLRYPNIKHLVTAMGKVTSRLDIDSVLGQIVSALTDDLGGVFSAVWLVGTGDMCHDCGLHGECLDQDRCLHLKAWSGRYVEDPGVHKRIPVGVLKIGVIGLSRSPYITNEISEDPLITDTEWFIKSGVNSFAGFPLLQGDELLGVMAYFGDRPISGELGDMLHCLAHQSAMAVVDAESHRRVRESEERYRALIDGAIDAVFILGPGGSIITASRSATRLLGYDCDELSHMSIEDLDRGSFDALKDSYPTLLAGGTVTYLGNFTTKSGGLVPVEVKAGATMYGGDTAIQAFVRDMTDRARMEKQKADMVSMLTHDLKGPLSIVMGYSEVIKDQYWDELSEFVQEGVDAIYRGGEKLLGLVNDYLSLSKMESGTLTMHKYPTSIGQVVNRSVDVIAFNAEQKGLVITLSCPDDMPDIELDPKYMERAVTNLLTNAVKYTPVGGSVSVKCGLSGDGVALIEVSDTGQGIPSDELPRVFDKYYRASGAGEKGTGLGLAIVKSVVEGHGGTIEAESEPGNGSTFRIKVPLR